MSKDKGAHSAKEERIKAVSLLFFADNNLTLPLWRVIL